MSFGIFSMSLTIKIRPQQLPTRTSLVTLIELKENV